jgi:hypothetical protein
MKIAFTKTPTFTKSIIASAIFAIVYLATTSNLPSCNDTAALLATGGQCIERQSFLHTASGWLSLICLVTAVALLALKHKDAIMQRVAPVPEARQQERPAPAPGRASSFCAKCGTRIIAGDRFCQGCGVLMGSELAVSNDIKGRES